jgi:hypothetical protein
VMVPRNRRVDLALDIDIRAQHDRLRSEHMFSPRN